MSDGQGSISLPSSYSPIYSPASPVLAPSSPHPHDSGAAPNAPVISRAIPATLDPISSNRHYRMHLYTDGGGPIPNASTVESVGSQTPVPAAERSAAQPNVRRATTRTRVILPQLLTTTTAPERSDEEDVVEVDPPPRYVQNPTRTERTASSRGRTVQRPILPIPNTTNLPEGYARRTVPLPRRLRAPPARPRFSRKWSAPIADQVSRVKGLTDCLDMAIKLFVPYTDYNMGETDISVQREEARRDDNRNHSWIETLYNDTRNARLPKAMILLLEAQHNFEEELGQPHSPLPGANIICHHLNRPALPDELDRLAQPHLPYADWEPFLAAMYCIFGDHAKTPLIESILTRAPFPHHLIDVPVYFKAHMGPDDLLVQQLAMIRQMLESIIGRISVMVGETPELHGTAPHRKWARENAARRMWYPRYAVPDSVLAIAPRRNTYPSDLIQPYGPHPLLYTFEVEFLRWAAVALTG
ncbi:hypothetical protein R3P38DRAFT_2806930 [Favolaschia claudopus]|uniref:Uncharacterized protein n=1 Tax=Favolaschia claudopus TaxID=2862362 RepID=A0AAV9ZII4_9AGAR